MAEYSPSSGLPSRREEHNADQDAAKDHPDGCRDVWGQEAVIPGQRRWGVCRSATASWDAWDAVRPDALAFRQLVGRDADAGKLAALAPDAREQDGLHWDLQRQIDRRRDVAHLRAQDESAPGKPDAALFAAQSCVVRIAAFAQSAFREPGLAMLERLALLQAALLTDPSVAVSQDALVLECSRPYSPPEQNSRVALQQEVVAPPPGRCTKAAAGWSA